MFFFSRLGTRGRAVATAILTAGLLFFIVSPVYRYVYELVTPPRAVENIQVVQKDKEVLLSWDASPENDVVKYVVLVGGRGPIEVEKGTNTALISNLDNGVDYLVSVVARDSVNSESSRQSFGVKPEEGISSYTFNKVPAHDDNFSYILSNSVIIIFILFALNLWVLFFNVRKTALVTIGMYPSIAILPYLILTLSILLTIGNPLNKLLFSAGLSVGYGILTYLLILTSNILNGSLQITLPLEQAAKATQFIFSLISSYLMMVFILGANLQIGLRILYIVPFIFYFSYSGIWFLKGISSSQIFIKAIGVTMTMALTVVVLSIWPIQSAYSILSAAVIYYILLNVALENRPKLGKNIWIEYIFLATLIVLLLFTNSVWGINGAIV
ncbi:MAG: fibronectin type III domain-containing protein [Candidatus Dojkabacteria bacterium]